MKGFEMKNSINYKQLERHISKSLSEMFNHWDNVQEDGSGSWMVEELVDNHHGVYIPAIVRDLFELPKVDDTEEHYWEVDEELQPLVDDIKANIDLDAIDTRFESVTVSFTNTDNGDYGLIVYADKLTV